MKVAWAGELMLLEARWTDRDAHTVKFQIVTPNEDRPNPFKAFTKRRSGRAGTRFHASVSHVSGVRTDAIAYNSEFMLAGWGDTSTQGYTVTFWCEAPEQGIHSFEGYARGADTFMAALVELDEDDAPIDQEKRARVEAPPEPKRRRQQTLAQAAAMLCANGDFWIWVNLHDPESPVTCNEQAAHWLRGRCEIESRRELDTDPAAEQRFHERVRRPFVEWSGG